MRNQLAGQYDVSEVAFDDDLLDLSTIEVLVIPGPTEFVDPIIINSVHNFLATGGSVMALSDPVTVDQTRLSARVNEGNLGDLLAEYGRRPRGRHRFRPALQRITDLQHSVRSCGLDLPILA